MFCYRIVESPQTLWLRSCCTSRGTLGLDEHVEQEREEREETHREEILQDVIKCMETMAIFGKEEMNDEHELHYRIYMEMVDADFERLRCTGQIQWSASRLLNLLEDYDHIKRKIEEQDDDPNCDWRINNPVLESFETEWVVRTISFVRWEYSMLGLLNKSAKDYVDHMTHRAEQVAARYWRQPVYGSEQAMQDSFISSSASEHGGYGNTKSSSTSASASDSNESSDQDESDTDVETNASDR
ncbi:hypothetical protein LTR84_007018 [Exophiala bonariae]|uniref:Uncharacterized protein n=1 Tax=Exophiala bonariae TaxID=1690606 RepID=A0AAV9MZF7_9EURO|nr:hypothetical protein LTR84_007018 [Exophiala bonariae]